MYSNNYLVAFSEVASSVLSTVLAIVLLLAMITVHEFGHYISGKILGFKIEEFAIGFGPAIIKKTKKSGEKFSVRALPLGGFCAFYGEDNKGEVKEDGFNDKPVWKRIIVMISGALMNYIFALLIIMLSFGIYGANAVKITSLEGLEEKTEQTLCEGDVIVKAQGKNVYLITDLMKAIKDKEKGEIVELTVVRDGEKQSLSVSLLTDTNFESVEDYSRLCYSLGAYKTAQDGTYGGLETTNVRLGFFETIGKGFEYSFKLAGTIFTVLGELLTGRIGLSSMGGTITTLSATANAVKVGGFKNFLYMGSFIGVNLAVFNLLPIPALDGSRVIFCIIEGIRKKPLNRKVEGIIHTVGLIALLMFAVMVDLMQCF